MLELSGKGLSKNLIAGIVALVVIVGAMGALSMSPPGGGGGQSVPEEPNVVVAGGQNVGNNEVTLTVRNSGNVQLRVNWVIVKEIGIEGSVQLQDNTGYGQTLKPGETLDAGVGLSQGVFESGKSYDLNVTIRTDKGDFEQQYTISVTTV